MGVDLVEGRSARESAIADDIEAWMQRRKAQVGQFARDAEAVGRQVWNDATRAGHDVLARTQSELKALGARQLQTGRKVAPVHKTAGLASGVRPDRSVVDRTEAGGVAQIAGNVVGLGQGAVHSAEGIGKGLLFTARLLNPDDAEINGADNSAWGQAFNAGKNAIGYVRKGIANPAEVATDIQNIGHRLYVDTVPSATPMADTLTGEMGRSYNLGRNQGELYRDLGSLLFGGAASKELRGLSSPAKFVKQGFSPSQAEYLAAPYEGMGHHFVPTNALKPVQLPRSLNNSPFNILKPHGMSRGDFYELHYRVDPHFHSASLPARVGGGIWNGDSLGLKEYGPWASLWHASPAPLNAAVGVAGFGGLANYEPAGDGAQ